MSQAWYALANSSDVASPALLVYPQRIESNLRRMIAIAGTPARLRTHVKTHKLPQLVQLQLERGIHKFKCATLREAEMVAQEQAPDVLVAYQLVGPNIERFADLCTRFPASRFSSLIDDASAAADLSQALGRRGARADVYLDLDLGMHRTGIAPGESAVALAQTVAGLASLRLAGVHAYDGHIKERDPAVRATRVAEAMQPVEELSALLVARGLSDATIVAGGTPTFRDHAAVTSRQPSPGTCVLWDASYEDKYGDLDFQWAAVLLTRVVSRPTPDRLCVDLGFKAVASDNPDPRVFFPELPDARAVIHSEEHLALETPDANRFQVGDVLYGIPYHVCPTVALHQEVHVVRDGIAHDRWTVTARDRSLQNA